MNIQVVLNVLRLLKNISYLDTWFWRICIIHPVTSRTDTRRYLKRLSFGTHFSTCNREQHVTRSYHELRVRVLSASLIRTISHRMKGLTVSLSAIVSFCKILRGKCISNMPTDCCDTFYPYEYHTELRNWRKFHFSMVSLHIFLEAAVIFSIIFWVFFSYTWDFNIETLSNYKYKLLKLLNFN